MPRNRLLGPTSGHHAQQPTWSSTRVGVPERPTPNIAPACSARNRRTNRIRRRLAAYPSGEMVCRPVGSRVGNVKDNDPYLVKPIVLQ